VAARQRVFHLVESIKNPFAIRQGEAYAAILNFYRHFCPFAAGGTDTDLPTLRSKFDGVREQVA